LVDAETIPLLDTTGAATLDDLHGELERQGIGMAVAAAKDDVTAMLERSGFLAQLGPERIFAAIEPAVQALCVAGTSQALSGTNRPS